MRLIRSTWLLALVPGLLFGQPAGQPPEDDLRLAIVMSRHGIRAPLPASFSLDAIAAQPWPKWEVPPGFLTPHGAEEMREMGGYYRALFVNDGLLTGAPDRDAAQIYFRADSDERTIASAHELAAGLLPGRAPAVHARTLLAVDPLFQPAKVPIGQPDRNFAVRAVLGRIGGDPANVLPAIRPGLRLLERVLLGGDVVPQGKVSVLDWAQGIRPGLSDTLVVLDGPLHRSEYLAEYFLLEYTDGKPMPEVGWGRVDRPTLTELLRTHALDWDLSNRTFYSARAQGSNLASHILDTIDQAATGFAEPGALAPPSAHVVVVVGHDTNIANLGGLLNLSWIVPGTQPDPLLPGGALLFELRQRRRTGEFYVRLAYVSATLDQMRAGSDLTLADPPCTSPIFIPGCSQAGPGFDAPLGKFEDLMRRVIDPRFVVPSAD
jgi:4-phytase/acid phosphatase